MFTNSGGNVVLRFVGSVCSLNFARQSAAGGRVGQTTLGGRLSKVSSQPGGRRSALGGRRSVLLANFFY